MLLRSPFRCWNHQQALALMDQDLVNVSCHVMSWSQPPQCQEGRLGPHQVLVCLSVDVLGHKGAVGGAGGVLIRRQGICAQLACQLDLVLYCSILRAVLIPFLSTGVSGRPSTLTQTRLTMRHCRYTDQKVQERTQPSRTHA